MKDIKECFGEVRTIDNFIINGRVDEGFKEFLQKVKTKFKAAFEYMRGVVAKIGTYFVTVDEEGNIEPCISPLTMGQAYVDKCINTNSTLVCLDRAGARITGLKTKPEDAKKLYGSGDSREYWRRLLKESSNDQYIYTIKKYTNDETVNEVRLQNSDPQARYNVVVDNQMLKKRIKLALTNKKLARLLIWGAPGIGKTAVLSNVLDEMRADFPDYALIVKTLSNETPDNFTLPKYIDVDGQDKATDVPKTWLPVYKPTGDAKKDAALDAKCGNGLLFIDELSRATPQVLNVILPLINEGIFNGYHLGSGWTIIAASNRMEDDEGQAELGNALANRFAQVYYEPTVKTWREWADKQNFISPLLLQWLSMPESENMSGGKFYYMDPNEEMPGNDLTKLMCTPRSWTRAMEELAVYSHTGSLEGFSIFDIDRDIICMVLNQYVPADAIDSFMAFLDVISKIGNFDQAVLDVWKNGGKNLKISKKDLNLVALPLAQLICSSHADRLPSEEEFNSLAEWVVSTGSDQMCSYVMDVFKHIFFGSIESETLRENALYLGYMRNKATDPNILKSYRNGYASVFNKYKIDLEDFPNYFPGVMKMGSKFKESFKSAIVGDFKDALG